MTQIWTGGNGTGTDIGQATNWGGTLPTTAGNIGQWNGVVPGPLNLFYDTASLPGGFSENNGVSFALSSAQTGSVNVGTHQTGTPTIAILNLFVDTGAGAFTFGGPDTGHRINWVGRPAGAIHYMTNNSANTATLTPWIRFTAGGGTQYQLDFGGTGDWEADSYLENDNGSGGTLVVLEGPGKLIWNPTGVLGADAISSPITINGGELTLRNNHPRLAGQTIIMTGNFTWDPTNSSAAQTLSGPINGPGTNRVNAGALTLSGQSSYSGDTVLSGGELFVNGVENPGLTGPLGIGTIQFVGGTLGFTVNNIFDYSSRFSTATGQAYKIDTAGQNVAFTNAAGLSGAGNTLTKLGAGTLTLAGPSTFTGLTTVTAGKLVIQGPKSGTGNITVADGATLGITATNTQVTPATLTLGTASGATLEFDNVNSTTTAPLLAGTITAVGPVIVNVNSGALTPGQSYPLISWTSGSAPTVTLGILNGFIGNLTTVGNTIQVNITATAYKWTGANGGVWDTVTPNNWVQNGGPVVFANGGPALFDDTAASSSVGIIGVVQPTSVTVNNSALSYSIVSSAGNEFGGSGSLTKAGNGTLILSGGANAYTGPTTISAGTLSVGTLANGGTASDIGAASSAAANLVINGGTLQYIGAAASSDRSFTVGLAGGTIDASGSDTLNLTAATLGYGGNGPRTLGLTGTGASNVLSSVIANNGGSSAVLKNGPGTWVLTGANTYSGLTTINNGVLQIGAGGASGTLGSGNILNNGRLDFNRTGTVTVNSVISGTGAVTNDGTGTLILAANNSYTGGTYINAGTVQIGNGGASGSLDTASRIVDNGTLVFNTTSLVTIRGFNAVISGTGNVFVKNTGLIQMLGGNTYTGWLTIDTNANMQATIGNEGQLLASSITNNGTLTFQRQDLNIFGYTNNISGIGKLVQDNGNQNVGNTTLVGSNTYTGGTWIRGGGFIFGDGLTTNGGSFVGDILFTNTLGSFITTRSVTFNRPDDFTYSNNIISAVTDASTNFDSGSLIKIGTNTLTLTGNNNYPGTTTVGWGTLRVGTGGTIGSIGWGPAQRLTNGGTGNIILTNGGTLVISRSDNVTITRNITDDAANGNGTGTLVQQGPGVLTLTASNTLTGPTVVSNGTLVVMSSLNGDLNARGGTTVLGGLSSANGVHVGGTLNFAGGIVQMALDKSQAPASNSFATVDVAITYNSGSLKLVNVGPTLQVGDKFTLFNQIIPGGNAIPVTGVGFSAVSHLGDDGSVTITSVTPLVPSTIKGISQVGTNIVISATNNSGVSTAYTLLATNNLTAPLATWPVISSGSFNTDGSLSITNPIGNGTSRLFYILRTP